MKQFIERQGDRYMISEGIFKFISGVLSGKVDIAATDDKKLSAKGKELKIAIKNIESEVEKAARKAGLSVEDYIQKQYGFDL